MLKTYRVTFEVTQWREPRDWRVEEYGDGGVFQELELENVYITVPEDALIEDITPEPLKMGFYVIPGNEAVFRRSGSILEPTKLDWMFWTGKGWTTANIINQSTEDTMRNELSYIGALVVDGISS